MEAEWLDFSDPEDERDALELLDKAEKEPMSEFKKTNPKTQKQTSSAIELTCEEKEVKMSEQTEGQTCQVIELTGQEKGVQISKQTERQTSQAIELTCKEREDQKSEQTERERQVQL